MMNAVNKFEGALIYTVGKPNSIQRMRKLHDIDRRALVASFCVESFLLLILMIINIKGNYKKISQHYWSLNFMSCFDCFFFLSYQT